MAGDTPRPAALYGAFQVDNRAAGKRAIRLVSLAAGLVGAGSLAGWMMGGPVAVYAAVFGVVSSPLLSIASKLIRWRGSEDALVLSEDGVELSIGEFSAVGRTWRRISIPWEDVVEIEGTHYRELAIRYADGEGYSSLRVPLYLFGESAAALNEALPRWAETELASSPSHRMLPSTGKDEQ